MTADFLRLIADCAVRRRPFAVALVLRAEGSTPVPTAARALIDKRGRITGTVGGGRVEAAAQAEAVRTARSGHPAVFDFELTGDGTADEPICGGVMRVLVDPTAARAREAYAAAARGRTRRQPGVLLTRVSHRTPLEVAVTWLAVDQIPSKLGFPGARSVRACLDDGSPRWFLCEASGTRARVEVLVEPIVPRPRLLIVGGGHVGQAVALQAGWVGFDVTVLDDRPEFADPARFPKGTAIRCGRLEEEVARFPVDAGTYIVLVNRGYRQDAIALEACLRRPAAYIGMIGSRRKVAVLRREFLKSRRATPSEWARICAPIGLNLGAVTVPEIATSIVAQLIAVRRKRSPRDGVQA
jgi:xanthine dehydrogenase accessory factor